MQPWMGVRCSHLSAKRTCSREHSYLSSPGPHTRDNAAVFSSWSWVLLSLLPDSKRVRQKAVGPGCIAQYRALQTGYLHGLALWSSFSSIPLSLLSLQRPQRSRWSEGLRTYPVPSSLLLFLSMNLEFQVSFCPLLLREANSHIQPVSLALSFHSSVSLFLLCFSHLL